MPDHFDPIAIFESQGWACENCGLPVAIYGTPQVAHRIPQRMIPKYGADVVHNPKNLRGVCSLRCNDAVSISNQPRVIEALVQEIQEDLDEKSL